MNDLWKDDDDFFPSKGKLFGIGAGVLLLNIIWLAAVAVAIVLVIRAVV